MSKFATTVILLGAGASYGSLDVEPYPPPLGRDLFSRLEETGGVAAEMPAHISAAFRDDFERGMAEYFEHTDGNIMRFQRELALYIAQFRPGKTNAYATLINQIGLKSVTYCSLNYDMLFESAAESLNFEVTYDIFRQNGQVRLLKPHGSCNFWPDLGSNIFHNCTFSGNEIADVEAPIRPLNRDDTIRRCLEDNSFAPAIAVYAKGKDVRVSPSYTDEQRAKWTQAVGRAHNVFVVGLRVNPEDDHIWGPLADCKGDLTYFGLASDKEQFDRWIDTNKKTNATFNEAQFSESISAMRRLMK